MWFLYQEGSCGTLEALLAEYLEPKPKRMLIGCRDCGHEVVSSVELQVANSRDGSGVLRYPVLQSDFSGQCRQPLFLELAVRFRMFGMVPFM